MRRTTLAFVACAIFLPGPSRSQDDPAPKPPDLAPEALLERASYALGVNVGRTCKEQAVEVDLNAFESGLRDGIAGAELRFTEQEMAEAMLAFQQQLRKKQDELLQLLSQRFRKAGREFLQTNGAKPGVQTLPNGLQYEVLKAGTGPRPRATDTVLVHYRGTLTNGIVIDDSTEQGGPVPVALDQVITGWSYAIQLMNAGAKWRVVIPPEHGYGANPPAGGIVPPNAVLIYEIELVAIQ